ncbi:MAG: hypothetical protein QXS21_05950 [Thermoproteota archaeon]
MSEEKFDVTVEDVEIAVKIIERYLKTVSRAKQALMSIQRYIGSSSYTSERDLIARMVMEQMRFKTSETVKESEPELTQEEIERFKRVAEKFKGSDTVK